MVYLVAAATLFVITFTLLPEKGQDEPATIGNVSRQLTNTKGVEFVYRFKYIGKPKVVVVVKVSEISALERILANVKRLGTFDISCKPVVALEDLASQLGVAKELTRPRAKVLQPEGLYLLKLRVDYYGNTTAEYLAARRRSAERVLRQKESGETNVEIYKNVAERRESIFINTNDTATLDFFGTFGFLNEDFGSNVYIESYRVQFLENYTAGVTYNSDY